MRVTVAPPAVTVAFLGATAMAGAPPGATVMAAESLRVPAVAVTVTSVDAVTTAGGV